MTIPNSASMFTPAQRERMEQLENDKRKGLTRVDFARSSEEGGRFVVDARTPAEQYLAAASPWSGPQVGLEPPLTDNSMGSPVWQDPPLGEPHEVERAANLLAKRSAEAGEVASAGSQPPQHGVPAPASPPAAREDGMPAPNPMGVADAIPQTAHDALRRMFARRI